MKTKEFKRSVSNVLPVFMLLLLVCCAFKPDIIGKWREVGKTATIEFSSDGTFKAVDNQGMAVSGKYTLLTHENLRCEIQSEAGSEEIVNLMISIKGDELTLTPSDDSEVERYRRAR